MSWAGSQQPTLASADLPPELWEAGRAPAPPRPMRDGPVEALTLVADGECSPQCMVSPPGQRLVCHCVCRGIYHGVLAHVQVTAAALEQLHG